MDSHTQTSEKSGQGGKYLTFALSGERYGLEILKIQEIIGVPNITRVPKCPQFIKGVINLRGKIIPLVDLRLKFGLEPVPYDVKTCVVVINIRKEEQVLLIGIIVDTVLEVVSFSNAEIEQVPNYGGQIESRFVAGMARRADGALNILLDIEKALSGADLDTLAQAAL